MQNLKSKIQNPKSKIRLSSADEMDDLDPIRILYDDIFPVLFPDHVAVEFDGDPLFRQVKHFEQFEQRHLARKRARLAVDSHFHMRNSNKTRSALPNDLTEFGFLAVIERADENGGPTGSKLRQLKMDDGDA